MRILCCHATADDRPGLRAETAAALERERNSGHQVHVVNCTGKQTLYHESMEAYWATGAPWVNVEHDIVFGAAAIEQFEECDEPWCCFVYELSCGYTAGALGFVRFRPELMAAEPDAMREAGLADTSGVVARAWYRTDVRLDRILRTRGYRPHVHGRVKHLNETQKLADPEGAWLEFLERERRVAA